MQIKDRSYLSFNERLRQLPSFFFHRQDLILDRQTNTEINFLQRGVIKYILNFFYFVFIELYFLQSLHFMKILYFLNFVIVEVEVFELSQVIQSGN